MDKPGSLHVDIALKQGALELSVKFALTSPWTCLFGASGSGKTTLLRAIAGLVRPHAGTISLNDTVLFNADSSIWMPSYLRPVRMAAQQSFLLPGTVESNIGYGVMTKDHTQAVDYVIERFHLEALARSDIRRLSGGERQRVSLARAVASALMGDARVKLLLLDEPFAGMDAELRDDLAGDLRDWLAKSQVQVVCVTHDVGETFLLGGEALRLIDGHIVAHGPVEVVLASERSRLQHVLTSKTDPLRG